MKVILLIVLWKNGINRIVSKYTKKVSNKKYKLDITKLRYNKNKTKMVIIIPIKNVSVFIKSNIIST